MDEVNSISTPIINIFVENQNILQPASHRLSNSKILKIKVDSLNSSGQENVDPSKPILDQNKIGYFNLLPDEIFIKILKKVEVEDLCNFCLLNGIICKFIVNSFLLSKCGFKFLIRANQLDSVVNKDNQKALFDLFSSIGRLIKKSTFVLSTNRRIAIFINVLENSYGTIDINSFDTFHVSNLKLIFKFYGIMLNQLIAGWKTFESTKVYKELKEKFLVEDNLNRFLKSSLGSKPKLELLIRFFYRMICENSERECVKIFEEKIHWLSTDLKAYSTNQIAKFLICVFGPIITTNSSHYSLPFIPWWDLTDTIFVKAGFEDLGFILDVYYNTKKETEWNKEFVLNLFETIINIPSRWTSLNIAILLYYSGEKLALGFFHKKISDTFENAVECLCYLVIVTYKFSKKMNSVAKLVEILINRYGVSLIEEIYISFTAITFDGNNMDEDINAIDNSLTLTDIVDSQLELMRLLMFKIYHFTKDTQVS